MNHRGSTQNSAITTYEDCHLTLWCNEYEKKDYNRDSDFKAIVAAHKKTHQLAIQAEKTTGQLADNIHIKINAENNRLLKCINNFRNKYGHHNIESDL